MTTDTDYLSRNVEAARAILTRAESENRDLTEAETAEHGELVRRAEALGDQIRRSRDLQGAMPAGLLDSLAGGDKDGEENVFDAAAKLNAAPKLALTRAQIGTLHNGLLTRAVTSATAPQTAISDFKTMPGGTYPVLRDAFRILDLIPVEATDKASVTYYRGNAAASNAKVTGEGGQKPLSDPSYTAVNEPVRKIAHYLEASEEALSDLGSFADMLEAEALMGLLNEENTQILAGTGAAVAGTGGTQFTGLLNTSGILTYAPVAAEPRFDSLVIAAETLATGSSFAQPTSVIIHPTDYRRLVLSKTTGSGEYLVNDMLALLPTLYVTNRIPVGTALVANLAQAARVYVRMVPTVKVDPYSRSTENIIKVIVEERLALTVPRPTAIAKVTFNGTG